MGETIIVVLIVAAVAVMAGRFLYRTLTGKSEGCGCRGGCSSAGGCCGPVRERCNTVTTNRNPDAGRDG